mmetsp:Transcript_95473/g.165850  ORF Transcript_95473/g.165850 Transcript_95473/m.165850 type:complete len:690 (+) Transcript_95473:96-2165(+)
MPILGGLRKQEAQSTSPPDSPHTPPLQTRKSALSSRSKSISKERGTKESGASSASGRSGSISFDVPDDSDDEEGSSQPRDREGFSSKDSRRSFSSRFSGLRASIAGDKSQDSASGDRSHSGTKDTTGSSGSGGSNKERHIFGRSKSSIGADSRKSVRISSKRKSSKRSSTRSRSRSRSSTTGDSWSSSSSEDLAEQDLSGVDQNILPLHMREGAIVQSRASTKLSRASSSSPSLDMFTSNPTRSTALSVVSGPIEEEDFQEEEREDSDYEWVDNRSQLKKFLSMMLGYEPDEKEREHILMPQTLLCMCTGPFFCWVFIAVVFLALWVWRFYFEVFYEAQRVCALAAIVSVETDMNNMLAPAYAVASTIAFGARAGLLNTSDPFKMLERLVTPNLLASPDLRVLRVVGAAKQVALVRPGSLHMVNAEGDPVQDRAARVFGLSDMCLPSDPVACLNLDNSDLMPVASSGASLRWQRPIFISADTNGVPMDMSQWVLGHRLAVELKAPGDVSHNPMAFEVTIALKTITDVKNPWNWIDGESDVEAFVCLKDGTLLSSDIGAWKGKASLDPHTRKVVYQSLWDLQLPWADQVTKEMLSEQTESEGWDGENLIVTRPVRGGKSEAASYQLGEADLRVVVMVPLKGSVSPHLRRLGMAALFSLCAPGVFLFCGCCGCLTKSLSLAVIRQIFFRIE